MNQLKVVKRNGMIEPFRISKIKSAVKKCCIRSNYNDSISKYLDDLGKRIYLELVDIGQVDVETIQDLVVDDLRKYLSEDIANAYEEYRIAHAKIRDAKYNKNFYDTVLQLTQGIENESSNENANKDPKQSYVIRDLMAGETSKKLYRDLVMSPHIKELHDKGVIHVHDCDYRLVTSLTNCCLINLKDIFEHGTVINGKLIESPKSLKTAATVATQVVAAVASSQYGGISISIAHLAPFIRSSEDRLSYLVDPEGTLDRSTRNEIISRLLNQEIKDSIQTIHYQLNTLYTSSGQSPFVTIWLRVNEYPEYEHETYLLIKEVLKQRIDGMKSPTGNTINPAFPKLVYCLSECNIHEDSKYYDLTQLAAECTSKRMVPDYVSEKVMMELKDSDVFPPMGCRSFLTPYKDEYGNYKHYGRLNLGVISLNLPYVAMASKSEDDFFKDLDKYARIICDEQYLIAERISDSPTERSPIMWNYGAISRLPIGSKIGDLLRTHKGYATVSLGYVGVAECAEVFGHKYLTEDGKQFGIKILRVLNSVTNEYKSRTPYDFSIYGTPEESLTTKFAKVLKRFKKVDEVNDKEYVTNSYHIPVTTEVDAFNKLDFESELQKLSGGGAISYVEMPDIRNNPEAALSIMKFIYEHIMYAEINTTSCDICYKCGFEGGIEMDSNGGYKCPNCGNTDIHSMYVIRRMCGYLGQLSNGISKGRWHDIINRVKHA